MPCIICIQMCDLVNAVKRAYERHYRDHPLFACPNISICPDTRKIYTADTQPAKQKKKSTLWRRVYRTILRCFKGAK
ncbi:hypothetical protein EON65_16045 [archaeon]|nr:MAG: hypothetical protein EON65_16045 [archaeon]